MSAKVDLLSYLKKGASSSPDTEEHEKIKDLAKKNFEDAGDKFGLLLIDIAECGRNNGNPADKAIVGALACLASFRGAFPPEIAAALIHELCGDLKEAYGELRAATIAKLEAERAAQN